MKQLFQPDIGISRFLGTLTDLFIINFLFLLTSLPVVTIGVASASMYYTLAKTIRKGYGNVWNTYWHAFLQNLKHGLILNTILLLYAGLIAFSTYYVSNTIGIVSLSTYWPVLGVGLFIPMILLLPYLYPLLSRFTLKTTDYLRLALGCSVRNFWRTLVLLFMFVASIALTCLTPLSLLIVPVLTCYGSTFLLEPILIKLWSQDRNQSVDVRSKGEVDAPLSSEVSECTRKK